MVIDKDWLACKSGLALSRPLHWYIRAILNYLNLQKKKKNGSFEWQFNEQCDLIWPFLFLFQVLEDREGKKKRGGVKLFFFESKICLKNQHVWNFWRHISIYIWRYRLWQVQRNGGGGGGEGGGGGSSPGDRTAADLQNVQERREEKKTDGKKKRCEETEKQNFFSCWDLNC